MQQRHENVSSYVSLSERGDNRLTHLLAALSPERLTVKSDRPQITNEQSFLPGNGRPQRAQVERWGDGGVIRGTQGSTDPLSPLTNRIIRGFVRQVRDTSNQTIHHRSAAWNAQKAENNAGLCEKTSI
ncbi:unnamed protein product [Arctogadus glacialis]